jgi:hypothetical protein
VIGNLILHRKPGAELVADEASPAVELAARRNGSFDVALFWDRRSGRLWVDVLHLYSGESLRIAAPPAQALDVFRHPFTYCLPA